MVETRWFVDGRGRDKGKELRTGVETLERSVDFLLRENLDRRGKGNKEKKIIQKKKENEKRYFGKDRLGLLVNLRQMELKSW